MDDQLEPMSRAVMDILITNKQDFIQGKDYGTIAIYFE